MDYILCRPLNDDEVDFINRSTIEIELHNISIASNDSGWCDMDTRCRIVTHKDRVIFKNVSDPNLLILRLKFDDRLKQLHDGLKTIYNIN